MGYSEERIDFDPPVLFRRHRGPAGEAAEFTGELRLLSGPQDLLDLGANCGCRQLVFRENQIDPAFFDLSSRLAGEILQKASNYRLRLAIVGDFASRPSRSLADFIRESNRTGQVLFVAGLGQALDAFCGAEKETP